MIVKEGTLEELPVGEAGEIAVRGPQVMKGYWNREEQTKKTLIDGWLLTGDMGRMDEEGYFFVVDRKKDMIIAGGLNIRSEERRVGKEYQARIMETIVSKTRDVQPT